MAYTPKTVPHDGDVDAFLAALEPAQRREDAQALTALMAKVSGEPPRLHGAKIIGFGVRQFRYADGKAGETLRMGFMPGAGKLNLYVRRKFPGSDEIMRRLGKHATGTGCTYVRRMADVDLGVLEELLRAGWNQADDAEAAPNAL